MCVHVCTKPTIITTPATAAATIGVEIGVSTLSAAATIESLLLISVSQRIANMKHYVPSAGFGRSSNVAFCCEGGSWYRLLEWPFGCGSIRIERSPF